MNEPRRVNWWVRIQVGLLTALLVAIATYHFLQTQPPGQIDAGLLAILVLIIALVLSEAFDNFSVGKMISFSRKIEEKEKEVKKLEDQNTNLLSQLINLSNQQSQNQSHTNVFGDYLATPKVQKATDEEIQKSRELDGENELQEVTQDDEQPAPTSLSFYKMEQIAFDKYIDLKQYNNLIVLREVKLVTDFFDVDSISNSPLIFDGYVPSAVHEVFIEVRNPLLPSSFRDRLYVMLSKIDHYRRKKGVEAHLELVLVTAPSRPMRAVSEERLLREFQPAVASRLLQITKIELTAEDEVAGIASEAIEE